MAKIGRRPAPPADFDEHRTPGTMVLVAIFLAPQLGDPAISNSIFTIIQEGQGFISPGILAVFAFGLLVRKGPAV